MSFPRLDLSEVFYIGLELPRHTRILSCPILIIIVPNPIFAIHKRQPDQVHFGTLFKSEAVHNQRPQADSQICTNLTIAQKSGIFSSLPHRFYYLSKILLSPLSGQTLLISTLDKGGRSQIYSGEEKLTVCTGVKEGLTQPLSLLMCGTLQD